MTRGLGRPVRLAGAGAVAVAVLVALCLAVAIGAPGGGRKPPPTGSPVPTAAPSVAPTATPQPSGSPGSDALIGSVKVSPVTISVDPPAGTARGGERLTVRAIVVNQARTVVSRVALSILATPAGLTLKPVRDRIVNRLAAGSAQSLSWTVCGATPGTYRLVPSATVEGVTVTGRPGTLTITSRGRC